jgi:hypothetical protein
MGIKLINRFQENVLPTDILYECQMCEHCFLYIFKLLDCWELPVSIK